MKIVYPFITSSLFQVVAYSLIGRKRSIHQDAANLALKIRPRLFALGKEHIPRHGPALITTNHYTHPGFPSWWITLSISALVPQDMHWIMAGGWTYPDAKIKQRTLEPLTRWAFRRVANIYDFVSMPPMPPRSHEVDERARAVRQALRLAKGTPPPILGIAPEGRDWINGVLQPPPAGAGRFLLHLAKHGLPFIPTGIFETEDGLCVSFGPPYWLEEYDKFSSDRDDQAIADYVMRAIACQLPECFRGAYA